MHSSPSTRWSSRRSWGKHATIILPMLAALIYAGGHLTWYLDTPLGQVAVLDEQENLALADAIYRDDLPAEPFYRAPGYALVLAGLRCLGVTENGLFSAALVLGVLLHALNAGLIARMAGWLFGDRAAYLAGFIAALYPVLVHFSTQALDTVPSLTLFLLGLDQLMRAHATPARWTGWTGAGLCWAAATLMRPNFFAVWLMLPGLALLTAAPGRWRNCAAALASGFLLVATAAWQWRVSGVPGFLPWQGAYNLWAANQPDGHGRYYTQKMALPAALARQNPARIESELLYQQATAQTNADIPAMNTYWRQRFVREATGHPFAWLGLMGRKAYALLNDWEQYNNKTYAFHQTRSPWLAWNPLSWGVLFVLGIAGTARLAGQARPLIITLGAVTLAYSASVLLFYVSDRFRLPLAALGSILAGGALAAPGCWRPWSRSRQSFWGLGLLVAALLTFSSFDQVRSRATFVQDHALLARAADTLGDDHTAWDEAQAALTMQPRHPDATRIAIAAHFNRLLQGTASPSAEASWLDASRRFLIASDPTATDSDLRVIAALALWRAGEREAALAEWRRLSPNASAHAARLLSGDETAQATSFEPPAGMRPPLVHLAVAILRPDPGAASPDAGFAHPEELAARLFAPALSK